MEYPGEKEMFAIERHVLYASHAAVVTHWEQHKAAKKPKHKANAKPPVGVDPLAERAPKPTKPNPKPEPK